MANYCINGSTFIKDKNISLNGLCDIVTNHEKSITNLSTNKSDKITYSSTPTLTGDKWIDGKPIYRKVVGLEGNPDASAINTGISNMDWLVHAYGVALMAGSTIFLPMNFYNQGGWNTFHIAGSGSKIQYQRGNNYQTVRMYFILEYTVK